MLTVVASGLTNSLYITTAMRVQRLLVGVFMGNASTTKHLLQGGADAVSQFGSRLHAHAHAHCAVH